MLVIALSKEIHQVKIFAPIIQEAITIILETIIQIRLNNDHFILANRIQLN